MEREKWHEKTYPQIEGKHCTDCDFLDLIPELLDTEYWPLVDDEGNFTGKLASTFRDYPGRVRPCHWDEEQGRIVEDPDWDDAEYLLGRSFYF